MTENNIYNQLIDMSAQLGALGKGQKDIGKKVDELSGEFKAFQSNCVQHRAEEAVESQNPAPVERPTLHIPASPVWKYLAGIISAILAGVTSLVAIFNGG